MPPPPAAEPVSPVSWSTCRLQWFFPRAVAVALGSSRQSRRRQRGRSRHWCRELAQRRQRHPRRARTPPAASQRERGSAERRVGALEQALPSLRVGTEQSVRPATNSTAHSIEVQPSICLTVLCAATLFLSFQTRRCLTPRRPCPLAPCPLSHVPRPGDPGPEAMCHVPYNSTARGSKSVLGARHSRSGHHLLFRSVSDHPAKTMPPRTSSCVHHQSSHPQAFPAESDHFILDPASSHAATGNFCRCLVVALSCTIGHPHWSLTYSTSPMSD